MQLGKVKGVLGREREDRNKGKKWMTRSESADSRLGSLGEKRYARGSERLGESKRG